MRHPGVRLTLLVLAMALPLLAFGFYAVPAVGAWAASVFSPGLGLKDAALIAFGLAFVMVLVMAVSAGDGLVGELGVMIPGVLIFFLICWLMLAWVF